jgi:hypothetical protein
MKRGFTVILTVSATEHSHTLEIWKQPWYRWALSRIYHWYDMCVFKLPGYRWLDSRTGGDKGGAIGLPLSVKQDIRCYDLEHKQRTKLAIVSINELQCTAITGRQCTMDGK